MVRRVRYAADRRMTLAYTGTMVEQVRQSWSARFALVGLLRALRRAVRESIAEAARADDRFDIVHAHWWFPAGLALWHVRSADPVRSPARVLTMHGSDVRLAASTPPARALMRAVLDEYAVYTAVSTWLATTIDAMSVRHAVHIAPMPVDIRHFSIPASDVRNGVLFVGRLNAQKGLADLLRVLAHASLQALTLDVVGDGADRDALMQQAADSGVATRVRWHGALPQAALVPLYQRAAVLAMPSREEGLGLVAVEAQLCGTPVVAYASGGVVDVVRPDAGGTLVAPGDLEALATAIQSLTEHPAEAVRLGRLAHDDMLARFSPASVARQYLGYYRQAVTAVRSG